VKIGTVFITGASTGIGAATGKLFADKGWNVVATMRTPGRVTDIGPDDRVLVVKLDVIDPASIQKAIAATLERFKTIDVVINNAGFAVVGPFEASTPEQVHKQFYTNVFGLMDVTRACLPILREQGHGVIVNIASVGGRMAFPLYSLYHSTKWAVEGLTESMQYELESFGIRVKLVEPGPIKTDFYDRSLIVLSRPDLTAYDAYVKQIEGRANGKGATGASPESVAKVIWRASTDGSRRLRYSANSALLLAARKLLPDAWLSALIRRSFR
jgi:NAD(P)-dependent dehydrogenase (short-subunit alcohol dehydrogenase family)